jgi:hypothetical protein
MVATPALVGIVLLLRAAEKPLWTQEAAGWVQAIGSIAAIWFAYLSGQKQARDALVAVREADKIAADRKLAAVLAVVDSAQRHAHETAKPFKDDKVSFLMLHIYYSNHLMTNMKQALETIPAHELGSYDAVSALLILRQSMNDLHGNVERAVAKFHAAESEGAGIPNSIEFQTAPIGLCIERIDACVQILHGESLE